MSLCGKIWFIQPWYSREYFFHFVCCEIHSVNEWKSWTLDTTFQFAWIAFDPLPCTACCFERFYRIISTWKHQYHSQTLRNFHSIFIFFKRDRKDFFCYFGTKNVSACLFVCWFASHRLKYISSVGDSTEKLNYCV